MPQQVPTQRPQQMPLHQQQQGTTPHGMQHAAPASQGPSLFGQMASTAAGVAVGSSVGHGISNMLFGSRAEPAPAAEAPPAQPYDQAAATAPGGFSEPQMGINCEPQSKEFLACLEKTNDLNSCTYYLEQLKACQAAARPY